VGVEAGSAAAVVQGKVADEVGVRGTVDVRVAAALGSVHGSHFGWRMGQMGVDRQGAGAGVEDTVLVVLHEVVDKPAWARVED
jgi:hypothetical protein